MNLLESLYLLESTFLAPSGAIKHGYGIMGAENPEPSPGLLQWVNEWFNLPRDLSRSIFTQFTLLVPGSLEQPYKWRF